jgi:hypothetical protein
VNFKNALRNNKNNKNNNNSIIYYLRRARQSQGQLQRKTAQEHKEKIQILATNKNA